MSFRDHTIWGRGVIPLEEWKFRSFKRLWLPVVDVLYIAAGVTAACCGVPAFTEFFPRALVAAWGLALAAAGLLCLIGISFPRLWPVEIAGKALVLGLIVTYIVSSILLAGTGESQRGFVIVISLLALIPIFIRMSVLGSEWADRRAKRTAAL